MKQFYKDLFDSTKNKRFFYRLLRSGRTDLSILYQRHSKILKHAGLGGKSHVMGKGHVSWNRKGRW
jgi:hypothetical protein